jgi:type VI secretion system secreted protein VgrG
MFKMENILLGKSLNIGGAYNIIVGAMKNETVVFTSSETVGQDKFSTITKKYTLDVGEEIILKTGSSSLVMKQDGTIELSGINVKIAGSEHVEICSAIIDIN